MSLSEQNRALIEREEAKLTPVPWSPDRAELLSPYPISRLFLDRLLDAARQDGSAERAGGDGGPVHSLSVQAADKPLQAEGAPAAEGALLSEHQARDHLRILLGEMSVNCWAKTHGLTAQQVDSFLRGVRPLEPKLAGVLGLVRTPFYHRRIDHV